MSDEQEQELEPYYEEEDVHQAKREAIRSIRKESKEPIKKGLWQKFSSRMEGYGQKYKEYKAKAILWQILRKKSDFKTIDIVYFAENF